MPVLSSSAALASESIHLCESFAILIDTLDTPIIEILVLNIMLMIRNSYTLAAFKTATMLTAEQSVYKMMICRVVSSLSVCLLTPKRRLMMTLLLLLMA